MLLVTMVIALVVIAGCGKEETTVKTTEEKTTVEEKDGETVDKRGSEVTEEDVGSPFYPGAEIDEESAYYYSSDEEAPRGGVTMCSSDSIEAVVQWYRDNLKGYEEVEAVTGAKFEKVEKAAPFDIRHAVTISGRDGKVLIVVSVGREFD